MNLLKPTSGVATILGKDSRHLSVSDFQEIGYISENQRLPLWMTPAELLAYCHLVPRAERQDDGRQSGVGNDLDGAA